MTGDAEQRPQRVALSTADGLRLRAEWWEPAEPGAVDGSLPTAVLLHPHPLHGGNMHATVVDQLFRRFPTIGVPTLRFNFRGVQGSDGRHDHGDRERLDVAAAIDFANDRRPDAPVRLIGWSFGADLALATSHAAIDGWIAIAPPLRVHDAADMPATTDARPTHIIVGERDAFRSPPEARDITSDWANTLVTEVPSADHFFATKLAELVELVVDDIVGG